MLLLAVIALPFLDLPLSAIGDLITLPITRWLDNRYGEKTRSQK